jgi:hypothetical protein
MRTAVLAFLLIAISVAVMAQAQQQAAQEDLALAPGEVQKLFDGYAIIQAQEFLGLTDSQLAPFLPRFRALQETRRRSEQERLRLVQELNRMTNARAGQLLEAGIRERLHALRDLETRAMNEVQKARDALDETLDLRQQARFRVFEEQLERRKLELLMKARQANRANRPLQRQQPQRQQQR